MLKLSLPFILGAMLLAASEREKGAGSVELDVGADRCKRFVLNEFLAAEKGFSAGPAEKSIRRLCPGLRQSCCSAAEVAKFHGKFAEKREQFEAFKTSLGNFYRIAGMLDPHDIQARWRDSETCQNQFKLGEEFQEDYLLAVDRQEVIAGLFGEFLDFVERYYAGIICSVCDEAQQEFFNLKQTASRQNMSYVVKIDNCFDIYRVVHRLLPAVSDMMFFLNVAKVFQCSGASFLNGIDMEVDDYETLQATAKEMEECLAKDRTQLFENSYCKSLCGNAFTLQKFVDPLKVFEIFDKTLYAFERGLLLVNHFDFEHQPTEKLLQFSDGLEIHSPDRVEADFENNNEAFMLVYPPRTNPEFDLLTAWLRYGEEGISPHLQGTGAGAGRAPLLALLALAAALL